MVRVRKELVWDYDIPDDPESDEGFMAVYVARVLDRGTADDIRSLGVETIRRYLDVAPASRKVIEFWRWWLARKASENGDPHSGPEAVAPSVVRDRTSSQ
jgi:hypothetical protein